MFPAHAGMNRENEGGGKNLSYVPRARGDEPFLDRFGLSDGVCSPRTRG